MSYPFLPYKSIEPYLKDMKRLKVSEVARSKTGFLPNYKKHGTNISETWKTTRENFIKRHLAEVKKNKESLYDKNGNPTRRHLAFIAWAYKP